MAIKIHRGDAASVAQVWTLTPASVEIGDTFRVTINGKIGVEYVATVATVANVTAGLTAAWNASVVAEFTEITATDSTSAVTLTANTAGTPFWLTTSVVNGSGEEGTVGIVETTPGVASRNEVQRLALTGTPTGGTFDLSWDPGGGTESATSIAYNVTGAQLKAAIVAGMASVATEDIAVTGGAGGPWFVTFTGDFAATDVALMSIDASSITGNGSVDVETVIKGGTNSDEIKLLSVVETVATGDIGGTYTLSLSSETTSALSYAATAAQIQTALEALPSVGSGNVAVYGRVAPTSDNNAYLIHFTGELAGTNVTELSVDDSGIFNGDVSATEFIQGGQPTADEVVLLDFGGATAGTYTITVAGETTTAIDFDAGSGEVRVALEALSTVGTGNVYVDDFADANSFVESPQPAILALQFRNSLADTDVGTVTLNSGGLTGFSGGGATVIQEGGGTVNEQQSVTINGNGGTFTLTFGGQTTSATAYNASAATLTTNLEALSTITDVTVTGTGTPADPYLVTFVDPGEQNVAEMTADASSLTGGSASVTTTTTSFAGTDEVQTVTVTATSGTFTLSFGGQTTSALAYNISAANLETALEALSTIAGLSVSGSDGGPYTVTFDVAPLNLQDVDLLTADTTSLVNAADTQTLTITETTRSDGPEHFDSPRNWSGNRVPDSGDTIYLEEGDSGLLYGLRQRTTFTANASTDVITFDDDQVGFVEDQILRVKTSDTLPAGLSADTNYYVINLDHVAGTCQLSTSSGGSAVNITDTGTGTHTIALELEGIRHVMRWTGDVGLPKRNAGDYYEYRPDYLEAGIRPAGTKTILLGLGDGSGSGLFKVDTGTYATEWEIHNSGGSREPGLQAIRIRNVSTSSNLLLLDGEVNVNIHADEVSTLATITQRGGVLEGGNETGALTYTTLNKTGGSLALRNYTCTGGNLSA